MTGLADRPRGTREVRDVRRMHYVDASAPALGRRIVSGAGFVSLYAIVLAAAGCGGEPAAPAGDLDMIYWSGDGQVSACYRELRDPVVVRMLDALETPVAGESVEFRLIDGDGWVRGGTAISDDSGFARGYWTVGAPGFHSLEAWATRAGGAGEFARFTATAESTDVGERRITRDTTPAGYPAIGGNRVAWLDWRSGAQDMYVYDLAGEVERRIAQGLHTVTGPAVSVSGDRIVWDDSRDGNYDIYLYDLAVGTERRITSDPGRQMHPAIDGDLVVWHDERGGSSVYVYDVANGTERQITSTAAWQTYPAVSGDRVVWTEHRAGYAVHAYDVSTGTEQRITSDTASFEADVWPAISGDHVVWVERRNARNDVYLFDLATATERRITTDAARVLPYRVAISGDHVIWYDARDGGRYESMYHFDLASGVERRIEGTPSTAYRPAVSGTRIVWVETRDRNTDVYLYDMASACDRPSR